MNDTQRYKLIRNAIKRQQRKGVKIVDGNFGIQLKVARKTSGEFIGVRAVFSSPRRPKACALGCLLLSQPVVKTYQLNAWSAASLLLEQGYDGDFANGLTDGFDNSYCHRDSSPRTKAGYRIGRRLRREFIKKK